MTTPLRIGHRGAAGLEPENTLRSFRRALDIGVDMIETDLRATADGEIVLCHDARVDRTTSGRGEVARLTAAQVRDLGIPALDDFLELLDGRAGAMLELKVRGIGARVVRHVAAGRFRGPVVYASFHHEELLAVRDADPGAATLALLHGGPIDKTRFVVDAGATHAGINVEFATAEFVQPLHAAGKKVFVYTVNEPEEIERMHAVGVDGIISDFPDRLLR